MAEFNRVDHPVYSPTRCFLCARVDGPMVDCKIEMLQFATDEGPRDFIGHVYVCIGTDHIPGCAIQLGRFGDMVDLSFMAKADAEIRDLRDKIFALEGEIHMLSEGAPRVVSLEDARELVGSSKPRVPAYPRD